MSADSDRACECDVRDETNLREESGERGARSRERTLITMELAGANVT